VSCGTRAADTHHQIRRTQSEDPRQSGPDAVGSAWSARRHQRSKRIATRPPDALGAHSELSRPDISLVLATWCHVVMAMVSSMSLLGRRLLLSRARADLTTQHRGGSPFSSPPVRRHRVVNCLPTPLVASTYRCTKRWKIAGSHAQLAAGLGDVKHGMPVSRCCPRAADAACALDRLPFRIRNVIWMT